MERNKQISYEICCKVMRSDHLKRLLKIHNCDDKEVASKNTDVYELHKPLTERVDKKIEKYYSMLKL